MGRVEQFFFSVPDHQNQFIHKICFAECVVLLAGLTHARKFSSVYQQVNREQVVREGSWIREVGSCQASSHGVSFWADTGVEAAVHFNATATARFDAKILPLKRRWARHLPPGCRWRKANASFLFVSKRNVTAALPSVGFVKQSIDGIGLKDQPVTWEFSRIKTPFPDWKVAKSEPVAAACVILLHNY